MEYLARIWLGKGGKESTFKIAVRVSGEWCVGFPCVWAGGIYDWPRWAAGCESTERSGTRERHTQSRERWAQEASWSDTGHRSQGAAEATKGTARRDNTQELGSAGVDKCRRQKTDKKCWTGQNHMANVFWGKAWDSSWRAQQSKQCCGGKFLCQRLQWPTVSFLGTWPLFKTLLESESLFYRQEFRDRSWTAPKYLPHLLLLFH